MPAIGAGSEVTAPYLAALNVFEGSQGVQTALLMSQNGVSGLSGDACLALLCAMEEYHLAWLRKISGADFIDQLEVLADSALQDTSQPESAWLAFPDHPLPKLSIVQLDGKPAYLGVVDGETTWWMIPMSAAWQHGRLQSMLLSNRNSQLASKVLSCQLQSS